MSHLDTLPEISSLPRSEFAYPGPLRDKLIAAILSGKKTTTTGVMAEYTLNNEPLPKAGNMEALIDSQEDAIAVLQMVEVRSCKLKEVDLQHVIDEGEGDESVAEWRGNHERFWNSREFREDMHDPGFTVDDDTELVLIRFKVVKDISKKQ
ncbi:hypothetical protein FRC02_011204 [Tulasnella sp. 418]|nr:hypothetical protein FRC02_011204 [Tulasnella sp. 418]